MNDLLVGIDLGGTKTEVAVLDTQGHMVYRARSSTPSGNYEATLTGIRALIKQAESETGYVFTRVGIGTPGAISRHTGRLRNSNSTCLNDQALQQDLENMLGREVRISNDANCFTLSEAVDGNARGASSVFGVILGTGTGGGLVFQQQLIAGYQLIAGEWGHNPLPWMNADEQREASVCYCGQRGCIETWLSGPGMSCDHARHTGQHLDAHQIADQASKGDPDCQHTLMRYEDRLARGLAHVINLFDPEVIVLGGGVSNIRQLTTRVPERWSEYIFSDYVDTRLVTAKYGDSSGVRGAARLWA